MNDCRITLSNTFLRVERRDGKILSFRPNGWETDLEGGYHWDSDNPEGLPMEKQLAIFERFLSGCGIQDLLSA